MRRHMAAIFPDWRARGSTALLHETRSGWASPTATLSALEGMARAAGVEIREDVEVTGFDLDGSGAVDAVLTTAMPIVCDLVVLAPGPWARELLRMLELPAGLDFHCWQVREGEYAHATATLDPSAPRPRPGRK